MNCYLKKITLNVSDEEYMMYQEIPKDENGAINELKNKTIEQFEECVRRKISEEDSSFPRISYIMYDGTVPVGETIISLFTSRFGNIGYKIRPSMRGRGYGNEILRLAIQRSAELKLENITIAIKSENQISKKVAIKNGFRLDRKEEDFEYYILNEEVEK